MDVAQVVLNCKHPTNVFLLGLTCLAVDLSTWAASGSSGRLHLWATTSPYYLNRQFTQSPRSPHYGFSRSHIAYFQLFSTFTCLTGGYTVTATL